MKTSDQQSPHGPGIAETSGSETALLRLTPPGISEAPTEDVLQTPGELKGGLASEGYTAGALGGAPASALEDGFYKDSEGFDQENPGYASMGWRPEADGRPVIVGKADQYVDKTAEPLDGFLGRACLGQER